MSLGSSSYICKATAWELAWFLPVKGSWRQFCCITSCNSISEALKMNTSVSANRILFVSFNWNQSCLNAADFEIAGLAFKIYPQCSPDTERWRAYWDQGPAWDSALNLNWIEQIFCVYMLFWKHLGASNIFLPLLPSLARTGCKILQDRLLQRGNWVTEKLNAIYLKSMFIFSLNKTGDWKTWGGRKGMLDHLP